MSVQQTDKFEHARQNAKGWYESIVEMLEKAEGWEAGAKEEGWTGPHKDQFGATFFRCESDDDEPATWACGSWRELCEEFHIKPQHDDEARDEITDSVLSVEVRDGWKLPGAESDGPEEYKILLTTGGPALRIVGELGQHGEPQSAELQMQDWGVPWTRYAGADEDVLLRFARCFYFGE